MLRNLTSGLSLKLLAFTMLGVALVIALYQLPKWSEFQDRAQRRHELITILKDASCKIGKISSLTTSEFTIPEPDLQKTLTDALTASDFAVLAAQHLADVANKRSGNSAEIANRAIVLVDWFKQINLTLGQLKHSGTANKTYLLDQLTDQVNHANTMVLELAVTEFAAPDLTYMYLALVSAGLGIFALAFLSLPIHKKVTVKPTEGHIQPTDGAVSFYREQLTLLQQELEHLNAELEDLHVAQSSLGSGIVRLDLTKKMAHLSEEAATILQFRDAGALTLAEFWSHFTQESVQDLRHFASAKQTNLGPFTTWLLQQQPGSEYPAYIKVEVVPHSQSMMLILQDLTQERLATLRISDAKRKAEEATIAKALFLSTVSHEIRTPMNAIIGLIDLLYQENPRRDQIENLEALSFSAKHLLALLNDVLDFSKIEAGKITFAHASFDLPAFFRHIVQVFQPQAQRKGLDFRLDVSLDTPIKLIGDELRLNQILTNLVSNAIKFTAKGHVIVRGGVERDFRINGGPPCNVLRLEVVDTGIGIPTDVIPKLFEAFQQGSINTTRQYGGTGLGLSISKKLVELQGGVIKVYSVPAKGSCFTVLVPIGIDAPNKSTLLDDWYQMEKSLEDLMRRPGFDPSNDPDEEPLVLDEPQIAYGVPNPELAKSEPPSLVGLHVLIAEDNRVNRMVITKLLNRWGVTHSIAENGEEALSCLMKAQKGEVLMPDLMLLDLEMPVLDGYQVLESLQVEASLPHVPVIALSANAITEIRKQDGLSGIDHYLTKPIDPEELQAILASYLHKVR